MYPTCRVVLAFLLISTAPGLAGEDAAKEVARLLAEGDAAKTGADAIARFRQALAVAERHFPANDVRAAIVHNKLGERLRGVDLFAESEVHLQKSMMILKANGDDLNYARVLSNLGSTYSRMHKHELAADAQQRALEILKAKLPEEHADVGRAYHRLGVEQSTLLKYKDAEKNLLQATRILERAQGVESNELGRLLADLGRVYEHSGKLDKALEAQQRCLRVVEKDEGPFGQGVGATHLNIGRILLAQKKLDEAETHYRRGLQVSEKAFGPNGAQVATALEHLVSLYWDRKDWERLAANLDRQARVRRPFYLQELAFLSERERLIHQTIHYDLGLMSLAVSLAVQKSTTNLPEKSAAWVVNNKALALEVTARQQQSGRADKAGTELLVELDKVRASLAWMTASAADLESPEVLKRWQALHQQEQQLFRRLTQFKEKTPPPGWIEIDDIRAALPADSVLVEFVRYFHSDLSKPRGKHHDPFTLRYAAWIIPPMGKDKVRVIDLGRASLLETAVQLAQEELASYRGGTRGVERLMERGLTLSTHEQRIKEDLESVRRLALDPLLPYLDTRTNWILCPDGLLWLVPWAALPMKNGQYAVEKHQVQLLLRGRDVVDNAPHAKVAAGPPLILADPDYDSALRPSPTDLKLAIAKHRGFQLGRALPLPFTAVEAEAVTPGLERWLKQKSVVLKQKQASKRALAEHSRPAALLLSTHGFFLEDKVADRDFARLLVTPDDKSGFVSPLLRCGLLLSGCNHHRKATEGQDNGILTGLEAQGLDLRGTQLVVLSACETGLGQVRNGDGVAGLRQAFLVAGAQAVVASLWQVPDKETSQLMTALFDNLAKGQSGAASLRDAQRGLIVHRRERSGNTHPFYWASFTFTGFSSDQRTPRR